MSNHVFIIGAGASYEYNLPLGEQLLETIGNNLIIEKVGIDGSSNNHIHRIYLQTKEAQQSASVDRVQIIKIFEQMRSALAFAESIDNLSTSHHFNEHIPAISKIAIAHAIATAERNSTLYIGPDERQPVPFVIAHAARGNTRPFRATWLAGLFRMLVRKADFNKMTSRLRSVSFISFNYDRVIKHFLFHAIQSYYGVSPDDAADSLKALNIYHPYGSLGQLEWESQSEDRHRFGETETKFVIESSKCIRTFNEQFSTKVQDACWHALSEANVISFVGTNHHEQNLEFLRPSRMMRHLVQDRTPIVRGTSYGLLPEQLSHVTQSLTEKFPDADIELWPCKAGEFFNRIDRTFAFG